MGEPAYMKVIEQEITGTLDTLESKRVTAGRSHYSSRLDGPADAVFAALRSAFDAVRQRVPHTVIHATLAKGSPTPRDAAGAEGPDAS